MNLSPISITYKVLATSFTASIPQSPVISVPPLVLLVLELFFVHLSPCRSKSQIVLFATHLLSSRINFFTQYVIPVKLTPCRITLRHLHPYHPALPPFFIPDLKPAFSINHSHCIQALAGTYRGLHLHVCSSVFVVTVLFKIFLFLVVRKSDTAVSEYTLISFFVIVVPIQRPFCIIMINSQDADCAYVCCQ